MKKTLMIITPHMSTGGCPQVVAKKIDVLRDEYNVICVEWQCIAWAYVVQRNKAIMLLGDKFISLGENKEYELFLTIEDHNPDYIMIEEIAETFIPNHILKRLYSPDRKYKIFETTHSSYSSPSQKKYLPDKFIFVSPYSAKKFKDLDVPFDIIEYPIDKLEPSKLTNKLHLRMDPEWKHVVNVGLFTPGKNQGYAFEIARFLESFNIKFHFVGNQASNFEHYWGPIMKTKPDNCIIWGERSDVDCFLQAADLFLFTSNLELNPLAVKESLSYGLPTLMFNLDTYEGKYNEDDNVHFLTGNLIEDTNLLLETLGLPTFKKFDIKTKLVHILLDPDKPQDIPLDDWESTIAKQRKSRDCWESIKHKFTSYVPRFNIVNRTELPVDTCAEPEIINPTKEFVHNPPVLSYGHYGCYKSNKDAIIEEFDEDLDLLILIGGDVVTDLSPNDFYKKVIEAYLFGIKHNASLINLDAPVFMSGGDWAKECLDYGDWVKVPHFMVGDVILIFKSERENIINKLKTTKWHSFDLWMAWNYHNKAVQFTSKESLVYQLDGYSVLDYGQKNG